MSQPAGGETEPRTRIADKAASQRDQTTERRDLRRDRVKAGVALTLKRSIKTDPATGRRPCAFIVLTPLIRAFARLRPSAHPPPDFVSRGTRRRTRLLADAIILPCATGGKRQPFSSADERVVGPFRDDARVTSGLSQKKHKRCVSAIFFKRASASACDALHTAAAALPPESVNNALKQRGESRDAVAAKARGLIGLLSARAGDRAPSHMRFSGALSCYKHKSFSARKNFCSTEQGNPRAESRVPSHANAPRRRRWQNLSSKFATRRFICQRNDD